MPRKTPPVKGRKQKSAAKEKNPRTLPRVSQFLDMPLETWRARSCGIAALATMIGFWNDEIPDLKKLRREAVAHGAYKPGIGWRHKELAELADTYHLTGKNFDWAPLPDRRAWKNFEHALARGPVIVSVHKDFKLSNAGHLIIASHISNGNVFYNEPAAKTRGTIARKISIKKFQNGWKKRIIVIHP